MNTAPQAVEETAIRRIICQNCDGTVRMPDESPCPNCRGCPVCGSKLAPDEKRCGCRFADDPERVADLIRRCGVSEEQASIAEKRFDIRKKQRRKRGVLSGIVGGLLVFFGGVLGDRFDPQSFSDYVVFLLIGAAVLGGAWYLIHRWFRMQEDRMLREELKERHTDPS